MADEAMRIPLEFDGLDQATQAANRLAEAFERLSAAEERVKGALPLPEPEPEGPVNTPGGADAAGGRARRTRGPRETAAYRYLTGPRQQLQRIESEIERARGEGNT